MPNSNPKPRPKPENTDPTISKSISETVNGSHDFEIRGYSLSKGIGPGKYLSSEPFTVGGYDWAIHFYPDGKNQDDNSLYVSVFIALVSDGKDVRALFELTLVGKEEDKVHSHFVRERDGGPYTLKYKGSMWGYKRFLRRNILETSDYLNEDCLQFKCTVGVVKRRMESPKQYKIMIPPSDMGKYLKKLLENGKGFDIVFKVKDEKFNAHKLVLAARSPVFKAQFFGFVGNPNMDTVTIEDIEPFIFKVMLMYIYSDSIPDLSEITGSHSSTSKAFVVQHLLAAADRFSLDRLKCICESKLSDEITVETVFTTLSLAEEYSCKQLKSACLKFAVKNFNAVVHTDGYKYLEQDCPSLICELLYELPTVSSNKKRTNRAVVRLGTPENVIPELEPEPEPVNSNSRQPRRRLQ